MGNACEENAALERENQAARRAQRDAMGVRCYAKRTRQPVKFAPNERVVEIMHIGDGFVQYMVEVDNRNPVADN